MALPSVRPRSRPGPRPQRRRPAARRAELATISPSAITQPARLQHRGQRAARPAPAVPRAAPAAGVPVSRRGSAGGDRHADFGHQRRARRTGPRDSRRRPRGRGVAAHAERRRKGAFLARYGTPSPGRRMRRWPVPVRRRPQSSSRPSRRTGRSTARWCSMAAAPRARRQPGRRGSPREPPSGSASDRATAFRIGTQALIGGRDHSRGAGPAQRKASRSGRR